MKIFKKSVTIILGLSMTAMLLMGCGEKEPVAKTVDDNKIQIGMCFDTFVVERWERDRDVFVSTANELGAVVDVQNPSGDVEEQVKAIEYFIQKDVDVIVIVPIESEPLEDVLREAKAKGISIISYDRLVKNADVDVCISFDNEAVGKSMGTSFTDTLSQGDKVLMICGPQTDSNVDQVAAGFEKEVAAGGLVQVDKVYLDEWKSELAYDYINENIDMIKDGVKGIMCGNDNLASQVIYALSENCMAEDVLVVGQDADLDACQRIVEGTQYSTVYKPVNLLAEQAAHTAVDLAMGKDLIYDDTIFNGVFDVPYIKLTPSLVTKDNMDDTIIADGFHLASDVYINLKD